MCNSHTGLAFSCAYSGTSKPETRKDRNKAAYQAHLKSLLKSRKKRYSKLAEQEKETRRERYEASSDREKAARQHVSSDTSLMLIERRLPVSSDVSLTLIMRKQQKKGTWLILKKKGRRAIKVLGSF